MKIVRLQITNFRCIKHGIFFSEKFNVLLGPNNVGKTAVLEALNLALNPEISGYSQAITENDFFQRRYQSEAVSAPVATPPESLPVAAAAPAPAAAAPVAEAPATPAAPAADPPPAATVVPAQPPAIRIECVLTDLDEGDEDLFYKYLVPWESAARSVRESAPGDLDPFATAQKAIRIVFEGWYDPLEDDFAHKTYFLPAATLDRDDCDEVTRTHKRRIGFLIYRDFRGLTRPITLEPGAMFARLLESQEVAPKHFEDVLDRLQGAFEPITSETDFSSVLNSYKAELERFLLLADQNTSALSFEVTDRTRTEVKKIAQLYVRDDISLPLQKMGAGTRSLAVLAMLTLIMRRRKRGILALEEPETFLFPHAQRRVIDECMGLADQLFITTHSPYVLERVPVEGVGRITRQPDGEVTWAPLNAADARQVNLFSRYLRHGVSEALLGRGVIIVEGLSDKWWINGANRILHRKVFNGRTQEAFELQGVSIVSSESNSQAIKFGKFFFEAGLRVVCILDKDKAVALNTEISEAPFPTLVLKQKGLEELLSQQLPLDLVRRILTSAPHCKSTPLTEATALALLEPAARTACRDLLIDNKGSAAMHEWIIDQLDELTLPTTLAVIADRVGHYLRGVDIFNTHSLLA